MEINDIRRKLHNINWNFDFNIDYSSDSIYPFDCRKHFSYPATFIPEIPFTLIEVLSQKGDIILDPFGGIGTTFVQALMLERYPIICDINPVSTMVCSTIYDLLNPTIKHSELRDYLLNLCSSYDETVDYTTNTEGRQKELREWYSPITYNKLCFLISKYNEKNISLEKHALELIVSGLLSTLSSQNKGWAYIADNVKPKIDEYKDKPVFEIYRTRVKILFSDIESHLKSQPETYNAFYEKSKTAQRIFNASVIDTNISRADLIITSPPYPKMIDYVKSQRMVMCFLNKTFRDYSSQEIGARCHRAQKNALVNYENSMNEINSYLCGTLKSNGFLCMVLPDYPEQDNRKPIIESIIKSFEQFDLFLVDEFKRYIPSNRRTISIQWASLVNEKILIFRKE